MMANSRYDTCAESRKPLDERAVPLVIAALTCHIYKAGRSVWVSLSRGLIASSTMKIRVVI